MTTYYCTTIEEALRRVKRAVKVAYPGCYFGGCLIPDGKKRKAPPPQSIHGRNRYNCTSLKTYLGM